MDILYRTIANEQSKLFILSNRKGYDSYDFIEKFMLSDTCRKMDRPYDHLQFAGEAYIMETFLEEINDNVLKSNKNFNEDILDWIGYTYRYWYFYTNETSKEIYKQADVKTMVAIYDAYHCLSEEMAIDRLKESYISKQKYLKESSITSPH